MDATEIIGFLIVLFLFLLPLVRKLLIDKKRVEQQEEPFEEEYEIIEEEPVITQQSRPVTERLVKKDYAFDTDLEVREYHSKITRRELETQEAPEFDERIVSDAFILDTTKKRYKENPLVTIVKRHPPAQAMVILSEIFNRKEE